MLANRAPVDEPAIRGGEVISDERNFLGHANAESYMAYRRAMLDLLPEMFLVN